MRPYPRIIAGVLAGCLALGALAGVEGHHRAEAASDEQLPDLQTVLPADSFSVVQTSTGREFRYTHLIYDAGPGPLEIQPSYDSVSGGYRGVQQIFAKSSSGQWSMTRQVRVPDTFVFHAEHGHFHFPLASFGLYKVAADGGVGAPAAISPKIGFCIDDSYAYSTTVPNAGTFVGSRSSCADPTGLRGISAGGADEYDYRDPGQAVPIDGLADGSYWFRSVTDPYNDFVEADESNNETDISVTIRNGRVTTGAVRHPDTTPPAGTLTAPAEGGVVRRSTRLTASTTGAARTVGFVVDGAVVGTSTSAPFGVDWDTTGVVDGTHWVAARVTDDRGRIGTTPLRAVTVANDGPGDGSAFSLAGSVSVEGTGAVTTRALTSLHGGDVLVALVSSDGPSSAAQTGTVGGSGLGWRLVRRANAQPGASEIWTATLPAGATSATATSTPALGTLPQTLTLLAFRGALGVGASSADGAVRGAPSTSLTTTVAGGWVFGVGNDWDGAVARSLPGGQAIVHQWVYTAVGDTFWSQSQVQPTAAAGTRVTIDATAPTDHRWNLAAVEVVPKGAAGTDHSAPRVSVSDPPAGATLSGPVRLAATAADDVGVSSVSFLVDGEPVGTSSTPPFVTGWDSASVGLGSHVVTAQARDAAGNVGTSAGVSVRVDNSGPPPVTITVDRMVTGQGRSAVLANGLSTSAPGELLVAYVAYHGPAGAVQTASVGGGRLRWSLVKRSNTQAGTAEVWSAYAGTRLRREPIRAVSSEPGFDGMLTVVAYRGASGTGVASAAGATTGAPSIYLPGVARASWGFAVGNDPDGAVARTPEAGQTLHQQWVDTTGDATFWVQSMAAPNPSNGLDTIAETGPVDHRWNYAAVEIQAARGR